MTPSLRQRIRSVLALPSGPRWIAVLGELEIFTYQVWCKLRSRPFHYPICEAEIGHRYLVTKGIPNVAFRVFGRVVTLLTDVVLEQIHDPACPACRAGTRQEVPRAGTR